MILTKRHDTLYIPLWLPSHRQESFHLARNKQLFADLNEIQWLDAKPISARKESFLLVIPEDEGKFSAKVVDGVQAVKLVPLRRIKLLVKPARQA
jgi:hypothetical protein